MAPQGILTFFLGKRVLLKRNRGQYVQAGCGAIYLRPKERTEWSTETGGQAPTAV